MACCLHCLQEIAHQDCRWTQITEIVATRLNENEKPHEKKESGAWRIKEDKGLSASVVICIQRADCWGDVQYSWPGRLFTFFMASPLKHLVLMLIGCADLCAGQQLQWTTIFMTRKKRLKSNNSRLISFDQCQFYTNTPLNRTFDHRHWKFPAICLPKISTDLKCWLNLLKEWPLWPKHQNSTYNMSRNSKWCVVVSSSSQALCSRAWSRKVASLNKSGEIFEGQFLRSLQQVLHQWEPM